MGMNKMGVMMTTYQRIISQNNNWEYCAHLMFKYLKTNKEYSNLWIESKILQMTYKNRKIPDSFYFKDSCAIFEVG